MCVDNVHVEPQPEYASACSAAAEKERTCCQAVGGKFKLPLVPSFKYSRLYARKSESSTNVQETARRALAALYSYIE